MFPNLEAEQARKFHTNSFVAENLEISKESYENKKKTGEFMFFEIKKLLALYNCEFDYLFAQATSAAVL